MGAIANLSASLRWDLDDFQRGTSIVEGTFKNVIGLAGKVGDAVSHAGRKMTAGMTLPLAGLGVLVTKAASDAEELQSAFDVTFGNMNRSMNKWAVEAGNNMGRATQEMQEGAIAFGMLFNQAAPTEAAAARMSQRFTELAQDAASFYNTDFDTAMGKIRSGLTGESEPLRDFGVFLTEAVVRAKALEMGIVSAGEELNEQGKIMVRAALITEGLSKAYGDVARTSDSLANRLRAIGGMVRELAIEFGQILEPYAKRAAAAVAGFLEWIGNLPNGVKRAAVGFGVFLAAIGPLSMALSALAITILPLLLVKMGPLFAVISAIVNPIGTAVVMAGKLIAEFGGLTAIVSNLGPVLLRFLGPVGLVVAAFQLFGDNILRGLQSFWRFVSDAFGSGLQTLFATLSDTVDRVSEAFRAFMDTPFGAFISDVIEFVGMLLEAFITLAGYLTGELISAFFETLTLIVDFIGGVVETVVKLLSGDWAGAWDAAVQTVGRAIIRIGQWIENIWPWLGGMIKMLGQITGAELSEPKKPGAMSGSGGGGVPSEGISGGNYTIAGTGKKPKGRTGRGRTGPTAEELADRREQIKLEQELAVARESNDLDAIRALERKRDVFDKIERYERAGLSNADARIAAERDMAELDQARKRALEEFLAERQVETEYQVAVLNNDYEHLRYLDDELDLQHRINDLSREGYDLATAEKIARDEMLAIEEARAAAASRRLEDEQLAHELELARLRGDDDRSIRMREEELRRRDRVDYLMDRGGMSRSEAEEQALREAADRSQAHLQRTFRDAFRNGLQAALDGNLKDFFEGWMRERTFNALSKVLDKLADNLANLISGNSQGGGLIGGILGLFGLARPTPSPAAAGSGGHWSIPTGGGPMGLATGGSFKIAGHSGIDSNLLSLNGTPVARVSSGEVVDVHRGDPKNNGSPVVVEIVAGEMFDARVVQGAARVVKASAPTMMSMSSARTRRDAARPIMPGGRTG